MTILHARSSIDLITPTIRLCEFCRRRPATLTAHIPGAAPYALCDGCVLPAPTRRSPLTAAVLRHLPPLLVFAGILAPAWAATTLLRPPVGMLAGVLVALLGVLAVVVVRITRADRRWPESGPHKGTSEVSS